MVWPGPLWLGAPSGPAAALETGFARIDVAPFDLRSTKFKMDEQSPSDYVMPYILSVP